MRTPRDLVSRALYASCAVCGTGLGAYAVAVGPFWLVVGAVLLMAAAGDLRGKDRAMSELRAMVRWLNRVSDEQRR